MNSQAFVIIGGLPGPGCGPSGGGFYHVDLTTRLVEPASNVLADCRVASALLATNSDGTLLAVSGGAANPGTFCIYDLVNQTATSSGAYQMGAAFSEDGTVVASQWVFADTSAHIVGTMARPQAFYDEPLNQTLPSKLNNTGSLYYVPYAGSFFDIIDVRRGLLTMRFGLEEKISATADSLAIDATGRRIFLLTDRGLTIVDLGSAPLSIGWLSPSTTVAGTKVTLHGSGFTARTTSTLGGQTALVNFIDDGTLEVTVPSLVSGPADVVLVDTDGSTYTLQNGIRIP